MQERIYFYVVLLIITQEVVNSIGIVTMLNPIIGYKASSGIARYALKSGKSVHEIAMEDR